MMVVGGDGDFYSRRKEGVLMVRMMKEIFF